MSIFGDKVLEGMDDLSQLITPYRASLKDTWDSMPDEVVIDATTVGNDFIEKFLVEPSRGWDKNHDVTEIVDACRNNAFSNNIKDNVMLGSYDARYALRRRFTIEIDPNTSWTPQGGFIGRIVIKKREQFSDAELLEFTGRGILNNGGNYRRYRTIGRKICKLFDVPIPEREPDRYKAFFRGVMIDRLKKGEILLRDLDKFVQFMHVVETCFRNNEVTEEAMRQILLYKVVCEAGQPFYDINGWDLK